MICESHPVDAVRNDLCKLYILRNFHLPLVRANFASVSGRQGEIDRRLCKSIWDHISNAFGWRGRGRLVEVEHVFDAQGGLHIAELLLLLLLLLGGRKITSAGHADGEGESM